MNKQIIKQFTDTYSDKLQCINRRWYIKERGRWVKDGDRSKTDALFLSFMSRHHIRRTKLPEFQFWAKQSLKYTEDIMQ
jgi:hypothetical protein